ncbi:MAG: ribonuclease P protein component [Sphingobacteriales bacterium]|nr:ribonuclease P protein component [Sphingobacteriales bacterium]
MNSLARYTLSKKERLKSRKLIEQLFREGQSFSVTPFRIIWMFTQSPSPVLQAGFSVSSKYFKKAVDRNRIKRQMRDAYRLQKNTLMEKLQLEQKQLSVFFIYTGRVLPEYSTLFDKTGTALKNLIKNFHENTAANT